MCESCPTRGTLCPECGADPCYHLCSNSVAYYSPEQEKEDALFNEAFSRDHITEAYAATAESSQYEDYPPDDREPCAGGCGVMTEPYAPCGSEQCRDKSNDDIPF
jgi:hypothetical protein